jgi:MarR family transcriptional regulator, organic hydroperoxide resistance regulator
MTVHGDDFVLVLQRATHHALADLDGLGRRLSLSPVEVNVLANLYASGDHTAARLARRCGLRPSTLTGVLDRLEAAGLIVRAAHPQDRRAIAVRLTQRGRPKARAIARAFAAYGSGVAARVPPEALAGFYTVVNALADRTDEETLDGE